ncbi:MAG: hypothetical protein KDD45_00920 [Bdellovibrionales bacterium]|nr:hypothetical protein [Bdellovibrionales bacterium]
MKHYYLIVFAMILLAITSCNQKKNDETPAPAAPETTTVEPTPTYLYVTTGACYAGTGNTVFTGTTSSNLVYRLNTKNGLKDTTFADFNSAPATAGDTPTGMASFDADNLLVLVDTTSGRRIEKMPKSSFSTRSQFVSATTILSGSLKSISKTSDNGYLVSKTNGIEKLTSQGVRLGAPYVPSNMGATCGTNSNINGAVSNSSGKIFFINAANSNNRWGVISANGYSSASDCLAVQAAPSATSYPVAILYLKASNQVLVAYAGNSIASPEINSIYEYDFNDSTNTIGSGVKIYDANSYVSAGYLLYGISAMTFDSSDNSLYVATAISTATAVANFQIEKLTYDPNTKTLSRSSSTPFYSYGVDTKCISSLMVAE